MQKDPNLSISHELQVMYFDTDAAGVVHNIAYLRFIEIARTLLAAQVGMSFEEIARTHIHPVVVRTEIDYERPGRLGDILRIEGRFTKKTGVRLFCEFEVIRPHDNIRLARCQQTLALLQMPAGKALRLPAGFLTGPWGPVVSS